LLKQSGKPVAMSQYQPSFNPLLSYNGSDVFRNLETILLEYLLSLPTCLDEFYKVLGELYVAEILKYRPDMESPVQLMKELLLGRLNANHSKTHGGEIVSAMMEQAARDISSQPQPSYTSDSGILNSLIQQKLKESQNVN
jgi:hypothetical protein